MTTVEYFDLVMGGDMTCYHCGKRPVMKTSLYAGSLAPPLFEVHNPARSSGCRDVVFVYNCGAAIDITVSKLYGRGFSGIPVRFNWIHDPTKQSMA